MRARLITIAMSVSMLGCASETLPSGTSATPVAVVSQLYYDYAWEVVIRDRDSRRTLFDEPRDVLTKYFDDDLTRLIERDRDCRARTKNVCYLGGAPIWDSNDPEALDLSVSASTDSTEVVVSFRRRYPAPDGTLVTLLYKLGMTPRGWRVRDIVGTEGGSLVASLRTM